MASTVPTSSSHNDFFGLPSAWSQCLNPIENGIPGRFEGEVANLAVFGEIPKEIDGTFYRIMVDPVFPPPPGNPPVEGDGNICAFRVHDGSVDMKIKYVETERLKLERKANKRLFGLYRSPFSHHPCVRAAIDSTANTNLVFWAGKLLALKEGAQPYAVDPDTLDTIEYDPFQCPGQTFSAHPKFDPFTEELVCFGYEAKGLATNDVVIYSLDKMGNKHHEQWIKAPWCAPIHDCAITQNFIVLVLWPFEAELERIKAGGQHWQYSYDRPATFIVVPRRPDRLPSGWKMGESRLYHWENAVAMHTASAWEDADGKLYFEGSRVFYNIFRVFDPPGDHHGSKNMKADYVRWKIDLSQPSGTLVADPEIILDLPAELARVDERFLTRPYDLIFSPVLLPNKPSTLPPIVPICLNGYVMLEKQSGRRTFFDPGYNSTTEEPIFIPRSESAPEGDGWIMGMVQRMDENRSDLMVIDTKDFSKPVAIIQLPFRTKNQVHGNWVEAKTQSEGYKALVGRK
ncbi:carotenoid oxygenase [Penicillium canescens]|uniref:Carotenoid oxygenase n=1 Tax=Penicillium canescens TaxID=5083 RepID=A0AAD6N858_PENCN|nr:carotenoid oxygenase [Penicillium canescens]KAJ6038237.1 carotenoid oxygenase [Penicillium canescens]KAJ6039641.1 carotenoid oxygenase [Penicillium canescens]KAJ6068010.1 carotenoid oxygenase [Penicillium canescens]